MSAGKYPSAMASVVLATLLVSNGAHADAPQADAPHDAARAQTLFDDAVKQMEAKNFAKACPSLAESFALDPAGGTVLDLAFCYEHAGQLASALHAYRQALDIADADGRTDRSVAAQNKIVELEKTVGHIRLVVPSDSWRSEKWRAFVDGVPLASEDLTMPTPLDRGAHLVMITAEGKRTLQRSVTVDDGTTTDVVVDELVDARTAPPVMKPITQPVGAPPASHAFVLRDDVPRRNWGIALSSVGVVGLGIGAVAAISAASLHAQSNDACPASGCVGDGVDSEKQADRMAWVANVSFVGGAVLIGAGAYLFFSARHAQRVPAMTSLASGRFSFDFP